jgi:hypothetical protein
MRYFNPILPLLFIACTAYNQPIYYSSNKMLHSRNYQHHIIGNVDGNIIVWETILNKHSRAKIYVYDKSMQLINEVSTNILRDKKDPAPRFYNAGNMFHVSYQYKHKNTFLYQLASFDKSGNLKSIKTLDSLNTLDKSITDQDFFYNILQSVNNKTICFNKMSYDSVHHVLKFNCRFITGDESLRKDFVIPFNAANESLTDIIVDNNKNVLVLKASAVNDLVNFKLIKQKFFNNEMLIAEKSIAKYAFEDNPVRIAEKPGGYFVFGNIGTDSSYIHKRSLYVWQTDDALNDLPGDTFINKQEFEENKFSFTANISTNEKFSSVFATWSQLDATENYTLRPNYETIRTDGIASYSYPLPNYAGYTSPAGIYFNQGYATPPPNYSSQPYFTPEASLSLNKFKIELFRLNNSNNIVWSNSFTDSLDKHTDANLANAKIIAGNTAIHIIYEVITNKKARTLDHIAVKSDGTFSRNFFAAWNTKYDYNLNDCVLTDKNELIIPAIRGAKMKYVKTNLQ